MTPEDDRRPSWIGLYFSFRGRIDRRSYLWSGLVLFQLGLCVLAYVGGAAISVLRGAADPVPQSSSGAIAALCYGGGLAILFCWILFALTVKRLHDRGWSGWLYLVAMVPLAGLWIAILTMILGSHPEANRYGPPPARRRLPGFLDFFYLPLVILTFIGIRSLLVEPFNIPSISNLPTLQVGDDVFVSKYAYGYSRYSFPFSLANFGGRIFGAEPGRGDMVVFALPRDPSVIYIKRVIGLPGDRVQMIDGQLVLNGEAVPRTRLDAVPTPNDRAEPATPSYRETLPGGISYSVLQSDRPGPLDNTAIYIVPQGKIFVLGDYRNNSLDSRVPPQEDGVGFVPMENLIGRAEFLYFSTNWPIGWTRTFTTIR